MCKKSTCSFVSMKCLLGGMNSTSREAVAARFARQRILPPLSPIWRDLVGHRDYARDYVRRLSKHVADDRMLKPVFSGAMCALDALNRCSSDSIMCLSRKFYILRAPIDMMSDQLSALGCLDGGPRHVVPGMTLRIANIIATKGSCALEWDDVVDVIARVMQVYHCARIIQRAWRTRKLDTDTFERPFKRCRVCVI